jgi:hypothetical protein
MSHREVRIAFLVAVGCVVAAGARAAEPVAILLQRQTQELMDAVAIGKTSVWEKYLDDGVLYTDENGQIMRKAEMVAGIKPLPQGVSGVIRVTQYQAIVHGDTAVASHVDDEHENYHGHELHCQYLTTDTWVKTKAGWRLVGAQVLALRADPPAVALSAAVKSEYCGRYALTPDITYEIRCSGDALEGQQLGRKPEELKAEAPDVLFTPGKTRYRKIFLRDADGRITGFAERREAWDLVWKRLP